MIVEITVINDEGQGPDFLFKNQFLGDFYVFQTSF